MCLRITAVITLLSLCVLWPLYGTGPCYDYMKNYNQSDVNATNLTCSANMTELQAFTIVNIPSYSDQHFSLFEWRLYIVVLVLWIFIAYTIYELHHQWIQVIALRRAYFLESDVWGERRLEQDVENGTAEETSE